MAVFSCTRCLKELPEEAFSYRSGRLVRQCKVCMSEYQRAWKARQPPERLAQYAERATERNKNNPEKRQAQAKAWIAKNRKHNVEQIKEWRHKNRDKYNARVRENHFKNRDRVSAQRMKRKYGITLEGFNAMLGAQSGSCAVCQIAPLPGKKLVVDHNHKTGKIRGLLCYQCNSAVGLCKDNPSILRRAAQYLENHNDEHSNPVLYPAPQPPIQDNSMVQRI